MRESKNVAMSTSARSKHMIAIKYAPIHRAALSVRAKRAILLKMTGESVRLLKSRLNAADGLDPAAADKMADENAQKQQKVFGDLKGEAERLTKIDVTELTKYPNATPLLLDDLTNTVKGVESGKKVDETKDPTMIQLDKSTKRMPKKKRKCWRP